MPRLFFALWPDEPAARALEEMSRSLAAEAGGRPVPREKIHLTLAFLGEVAPGRIDKARAAAAASEGAAFTIVFDCVGAFRDAGVAWMGMRDPPPPAVRDLQERLSGGLRRAGFALGDRPFTPHITLARRISLRVARRSVPPIAWEARAFSLVRSETGSGRYTRLEDWELTR